MLTNKKYRSDKYVKPMLIVFWLLPFLAKILKQRQGIIIGSILFAITLTLGIMIYRLINEGDRKSAIYIILGLSAFYVFIIVSISFLNIEL
ncbi:hypothetical protein ASE74_23835 [Pedobacter sp. Leaf216]|uniref:hypothetical protein n=1 Tax=Pedobacter sp. Leaf216 TaxID=1735684 RepID=UPI0006F6FB38|nr:hypothetical protein [Pedobacter sp. Leaf216]KQM68952.1 hypothetical protein ASE74_23835 [Pedobacter sp. Leaf216]